VAWWPGLTQVAVIAASCYISGIPQGSILGLLLFIINMNDLGNDPSSCIGLFADDCNISKEVAAYQDCLSLQEGLNRLLTWTNKWQLSLNTSKCKVICISRKKHIPAF